jgi:multiple sugar transport system substrate-binding protein
MKRKVSTLLVGLAVAIGLMALFSGLAGCRDLGSERTVTIRFWNGFTGPDGRTMLALVRRFNEENPDVRVLMQRMDWATYYNKLFVAGLGGRAPEVFVIHTDTLNRFRGAGFLRPIDDLLHGEHGLPIDDFDPYVIEAVREDGRYFGVPLDAHLLGMYYNRDLFRRAGLVDAAGEPVPPTNREEFIDALERLSRVETGDTLGTWGYVFTFFRTNIYTMMKQFGGEMFTEDYTRTLINSPENVAALQFAVELVRERRLAPPPEAFDSWIGFRQGRVGIAFEGIYMLPDLLRQADLDFGAAPVPLLGNTAAVWGGSHNLCLKKDLDERKTDAAWRFIRFLSENSLDWAEGGQIPVRRSQRDTERFRGMYAQHQFARQMDYVVYTPSVPFVFEYITEFDLAVERALRGRMTPQEALDTAAANIERIIKRYARWGQQGGES